MAAKSLSREDIKGKLLQGSFMNNGPNVTQLSDPVADTPMVIVLDKLRAYDHNPRINRNPIYDQLKASILSRGLDAPPPITRRPGEDHFIIRNGGNTRLAILNELWRETHDEQFFRINCLFRPWPKRGDIVALTGHLAENDIHGELTFIERALGIERARALYEQEANESISQRELARRLAADGYPVSQPHISKMQDCIHFLLPAIPTLLYSGLGKPQIERLTNLRRTAAKSWAKYADASSVSIDFESLFVEVLATFDDSGDFKFERFQDELIHQMQRPLGKDYNWLKLDILDGHSQQQGVEPVTPPSPSPQVNISATETRKPKSEPGGNGEPPARASKPRLPSDQTPDTNAQTETRTEPTSSSAPELTEDEKQERIQAHVVSSISGMTPRIQSMKKQLAEATGEPIPDFDESCLHSIPVQVGGLHPISDLWYIERQIDEPAELRNQIYGLVNEVVKEVGCPVELWPSNVGTGFYLQRTAEPDEKPNPLAATTMTLLEALNGYSQVQADHTFQTPSELGQLILGCAKLESRDASTSDRLSDQALVKIFRVMRLARRLIELETTA